MRLKKSFTLVELLIVIAIIGILAGIVVLAVRSAKQKAKDVRIQSDLAQIPILAAVWREDHNGNMEDFCDENKNTEYKKLKDDIIAMGGTVPECKEDNNSYAVSTTTKNGTGVSQCVDENFKGEGIAADNPPRCVTSQAVGKFALLFHEFQYSRAAGFKADSLRTRITWDQINPAGDDNFNFSGVDSVVENAKSNNLGLFPNILAGHSPTLTDCHGISTTHSCPPRDLAKYKNFVTKLAEHLKGKVDYYIIENEPDGAYWVGNISEYRQLRQTAYEGLHTGNQAAKVIDAGLSDQAWMIAVARTKVEAGDITGAVAFWNGWRERTSPSQFARIDTSLTIDQQEAQLRNKFSDSTNSRAWEYANGIFTDNNYDIMSFHYRMPYKYYNDIFNWIKSKTSKPIWNTEGGIYDPPGGIDLSDSTKAQDMVKMHIINYASGVQNFTYIPMINIGGDVQYYSGLMTTGGAITTSGNVYKIMTEKLKGFSSVNKISGFTSPDIYKATANGNIIYIAWSDEGDKTVNLTSVLGSNIKVTTYNGSVSNPPSDSILITTEPVYIEAN